MRREREGRERERERGEKDWLSSALPRLEKRTAEKESEKQLVLFKERAANVAVNGIGKMVGQVAEALFQLPRKVQVVTSKILE